MEEQGVNVVLYRTISVRFDGRRRKLRNMTMDDDTDETGDVSTEDVGISDSERAELGEMANELGVSVDQAIDEYKDAYEYVQNHEDAKKAVRFGKADDESDVAMKRAKGSMRDSNSGSSSTAAAIMLGNDGQNTWSGDNGPRDVLVANGLLLSDDHPAGLATFIFEDGDGVDLNWLEDEVCHPYTPISGEFSVSDANNVSGSYQVNSTSGMSVETEDVDGAPDDAYDRQELVKNHIDVVEMSDLGNRGTLSATDTFEGDDGEIVTTSADFGVDIKMIEDVDIVDLYADIHEEAGPWGVYTLIDDSVTADDLEEQGVIESDDEGNRRNGLTAWTSTELMEYGQSSTCHFFGTVESSDNGEIVMNTRGIFPLMDEPIQNEQVTDVVGSSTSETEMI